MDTGEAKRSKREADHFSVPTDDFMDLYLTHDDMTYWEVIL